MARLGRAQPFPPKILRGKWWAPVVTTQAASGLNPTSATGNGTVLSDGYSIITERGFCWSTSSNPTTSDPHVVVAGATGVYSGSMTSLTASTLYHYRAYAINAIGTSYGADTTFTTAAPASGSLFRKTSLNGLGAGGPFFHDPLAA